MEKCRILIVEDELLVRQAVKYILSGRADTYEIVGETSNGSEACALIDQLKPHVVISDVIMPVLDGLELTKYIKTKHPSTYVIILSGYSDFEYVKTCFKYGVTEYILKPKLTPEILYGILDNICTKLGVQTTVHENDSKAFFEMALTEHLNITPPQKMQDKHIATIGINLTKILGYQESQDDFFHEILTEKIQSIFSVETLEFHLTKDRILLCLVFTEDQQLFLENINSLTTVLSSKMLGAKVIYTLPSNVFVNITENVSNVYKTSKNQFFMPNNMYSVKAEHIKKEKFDVYGVYREKIAFFEESFAVTHKYLCDVHFPCGYDEEDVKKQVEHIIYTCIEYFRENKMLIDTPSIDPFSIMNIVSDMYSLDDLIAQLEDVFLSINSIIKNLNSPEDKLVNKMIDYIQENSSEQLNLKQVADEFHVSYSYLSTYLSHKLGLGFSEYLNKLRVETAKTMLQNTEFSVSEICGKVGYLDQSYFSKVFKKMVGVSPTAYRREVQEK